jgi:hypothetical protein
MLDRDILLGLLRRFGNRRHGNDLMKHSVATLAWCLTAPVLFKVVDLFFPFRGRTVTAFFTVWLLATAAAIFWRLRRGAILRDTAAALDRKANLHDEIKTAVWFIENRQTSRWIDAQLARATRTAGRIDGTALFPRVLPRTLVVAVSLFLALGILNFLPLSLNNNWFALKATPAFDVSRISKTFVDETRKLIETLERQDAKKLAEQLDQILKDLQNGKISLEEAREQISNLQAELAASGADNPELTKRLAEIARQLGNSKVSQSVANALANKDRERAIAELRDAVDSLLQANSLQEAAKKLSELRKELAEGKTPDDMARDRQEAIRSELGAANLPESVSLPLSKRDVEQATRALEQFVKSDPPNRNNLEQMLEQLRDIQRDVRADRLAPETARERIDDATRQLGDSRLPPNAVNPRSQQDLQRAADAMRELADSRRNGFNNLSLPELQRLAQELAKMAVEPADNAEIAQVRERLEDLANALNETRRQNEDERESQGKRNPQRRTEPRAPGTPPTETREPPGGGPRPIRGDGPGPHGDEPGGPGRGPWDGSITDGPGVFRGDGPGLNLPEGGLKVDNSGGGPGGLEPGNQGGRNRSVPPTSLAVQLEKEAMVAEHADTPNSNQRSASEQERSRLDYRNVPSELSPAARDVLNQEVIPWESREHVKTYFDAIRP